MIIFPEPGESLEEFLKRQREVMRALGYSVSDDLEGWPAMNERDFQASMTIPDEEPDKTTEDEPPAASEDEEQLG